MAKASCCGKSTMKAEANAKMRKMYAIMKFRTLIDTVLGFGNMLVWFFNCLSKGSIIRRKKIQFLLMFIGNLLKIMLKHVKFSDILKLR